MLRNCVIAFLVAFCSWTAGSVRSQTPEVTVAARSATDLSKVLAGFGQRGEMFGLGGPAAFINTYGQYISDQQPICATLTFTSKTPMFAAEFTTKDATAFWAGLNEDEFTLNAQNGELTKAGSSLRFFVRQNGNLIRISDNADFLKNVRWPAAESFTSNVSVVARIDWRNLQPEMRRSVAQQVLSIIVPQTNPMASFSIDALPELISNAASNRISRLFAKSESMLLQFTAEESGRVGLTADVVNRSVAGAAKVPSPFASLTNEHAVANLQWNAPIENDLRTITQAWSAELVGASKQMFAGEDIGDPTGLTVLHESAAVLARHCTETIALPNLQGSIATLSDGARPIVVAGIRVANPARLDIELQKLLKSAIENGAPFQFTPNVASDIELSVHRLLIPIAPELDGVRDLFGDALTIHIATSTHALLLGIGNGSEKFLPELVSPASGSNNLWFDLAAGQQANDLCSKLGIKPSHLRIVPSNQGFQITTWISEGKGQTQLTSTRAD